MRIAIASLGDPRSLKTWSGIPVNIVASLKKRGHDIIPIQLKPPPEPWYYDWKRRLNYRFNKKWFLADVQKYHLLQIGKQLDQQVEAIQPDVVIVIHGDFLAYSSFSQPACFIHDTTFEGLIDYYADFTNLTKKSIHLGNQMYKLSLDKAKAAIFSSSWASNSAVSYYGTDRSKVFTVPLGANLSSVPSDEQILKLIASRIDDEVCRFVFLGVDWIRKGGPDALRFVSELNRLGLKSTLMIAGCKPDIPDNLLGQVELYGFLRKNIPAQKAILESLLEKASALILLSNAECYGCVYCEANAYGLPAIGRDTGGVPEIIIDGRNGLLLKNNETPEALARRWKDFWVDKDSYYKLSLDARQQFIERLNYDIFSERLESIIKSHVIV